jgi:hypothetical protein
VPAGDLGAANCGSMRCEGRLPGPPEELIFRSGHPTVLCKSTTLLHAVDADEHRIDPRAQLRPHTPDAVSGARPAAGRNERRIICRTNRCGKHSDLSTYPIRPLPCSPRLVGDQAAPADRVLSSENAVLLSNRSQPSVERVCPYPGPYLSEKFT